MWAMLLGKMEIGRTLEKCGPARIAIVPFGVVGAEYRFTNRVLCPAGG